MKTRFLIAILFIVFAITYCSMAATVVVKISQFPNTTSPAGSDLFLLASGATNKNITWNQLKDAIGTNPATVTIINNAYISNLFATNIYATNITVNEFRGRTTFITNAYIDFITNNTAYITNLYASNAYFTNLYTTLIQSNFFLFNTNIYLTNNFTTFVNNSFISNYFQTNVFQDVYMSNFFTTNNFMFVTNIQQFSTNLTVTNFYAGDTYVSNFFNTNIFVNNPAVSNFFVTNIYNAFAITSNFVFNVAWPLTNATLWGTTTFAPESGTSAGLITLLSNNVEQVYISADGAYFQGDKTKISTAWFTTNSWDGPTNNLPMNKEDQYYSTATDCNITNLSNLPDFGYSAGILLTITNSAAANIVLRFPSTITIPERTNAVVISNASRGMLSLRYSPVAGTNGVFRQF